MAQAEYLARDFNFEINTGSVATPVWTPITGITSWEWKEAPKEAEATDFNDNGYSSSMIVGAKLSVMLKGNFNTDTVTRDPGQKAVEAAARTFGAAGIKQYRIYGPRSVTFTNAATTGGSIAFSASAKLGSKGGGAEALLSWEVELIIDGAPTYAGFFA